MPRSVKNTDVGEIAPVRQPAFVQGVRPLSRPRHGGHLLGRAERRCRSRKSPARGRL